MISDSIHITCNQKSHRDAENKFKAASLSARKVEKTGKYPIPFVANFRIDSFYKKCQTFRPG